MRCVHSAPFHFRVQQRLLEPDQEVAEAPIHAHPHLVLHIERELYACRGTTRRAVEDFLGGVENIDGTLILLNRVGSF